MLDLLGIVVSTVAILFIMFRAVQLDSKLPWFAEVKPVDDKASGDPGRAPPRPIWRAPQR